MKKNFLILITLLFTLFFILTNPTVSVAAAADGLLLWYEKVLPALLPPAILSNFLVYSNYMQTVTKYLYPFTKRLLPTSENGCFAVFGGIFFGFPMGSKLSADLTKQGKISAKEGELLSACFNQLSPVFISGYLLTTILELPEMIWRSYAALYLPPFLYAAVMLRKGDFISRKTKNTASDSHLDFGIIDAGIMNGFETLTKLGGYIVLFSVFAAMLRTYNGKYPLFNLIFTGLIEVTTGISGLKNCGLPLTVTYPLAIFFVSFGGFCGFAQTCSMTRECSFSKVRYLALRIFFAVLSSLLSFGSLLL